MMCVHVTVTQWKIYRLTVRHRSIVTFSHVGRKILNFFLSLFVPLSSLSSIHLPPAEKYFFSSKKKVSKKRGNSRNIVSPGVGKDTRPVPYFPKNYHTSVLELETNDLLNVRSRTRLVQSEGLRCVYDGVWKGVDNQDHTLSSRRTCTNFITYYESTKRKVKTIYICECRCYERLQTKTKEFTRLSYTDKWPPDLGKIYLLWINKVKVKDNI